MIWKALTIEGFEHYEASDQGDIRRIGAKRCIKGGNNGSGYRIVVLTHEPDKKAKCFLVSRLIATTFLPNPDNLEQVDHINGDRWDNRLENLQWITRVDNNKKRKEIYGDKYYPMDAKEVICLETGMIFPSQYQAAKWAKRSDVAMLQAIRKGTKCGGYTFRRLEE